MPLNLHLGCGRTAIDGWVNIDLLAGCDLPLDLNVQPLPYETDSVDCIFTYHAIEHLDNYLFALHEMWRVLTHGGVFLVGVPYVTLTEYNLVNPFHKQHFNEFAFDFFDTTKLKGSANEATAIEFRKGWHRYHYMPEFEGMPEPELTFNRRHLFNVVRMMDFGLYAVKPPQSDFPLPPDAAIELERLFDATLTSRHAASWA